MTWHPKMTFGDADPEDRTTLEAEDLRDMGLDQVQLWIDEPHSQAATINLDKERARELFNWLGVWLHRS